MKRIALFSLVFSNSLYLFNIFLAAQLIFLLYWHGNSGNQDLDLTILLDTAGNMLSIVFLLTCSIAGWTLYKHNRYPLCVTITLLPLILYLLMVLLPRLLLS